MTILAWDGKTLAADKMASCNGYGFSVTKIVRTLYGLAGATGDGPVARAMLAWAKEGFEPKRFPTEAEGDTAEMLVIRNDGRIEVYSKNAHPMQIEAQFIALGCGANFALAAMYLGHTARRAVEVACALDIHCGNGIDTLELGPPIEVPF